MRIFGTGKGNDSLTVEIDPIVESIESLQVTQASLDVEKGCIEESV